MEYLGINVETKFPQINAATGRDTTYYLHVFTYHESHGLKFFKIFRNRCISSCFKWNLVGNVIFLCE